jgi:hypothetical protein
VDALERGAVEEVFELNLSLGAGETEVHISNSESVLVSLTSDEDFRKLCAPLLSPTQRQVDVMGFMQRKAAQDCVTVTPCFEPVLGIEREVAVAERIAQKLSLKVSSCAVPTIGHLLKKDHIGTSESKYLDSAFKSVPSIDAADPFVDVPCEYLQEHESDFFKDNTEW